MDQMAASGAERECLPVIRSAVITTTTRNTLNATMRSLCLAGFKPRVFCDRTQRGCWKNYLRALGSMRGMMRPDDRLAMFEDDVAVARNLASWCEGVLIEEKTLISLYTAAPNDDGGWGMTNIRCPVRCWGALAFLWTREAIDSLLEFRPGKGKPNGTDHWVGVWCKRKGVTLRSAIPSLVFHTGIDSTLPAAGRPENRQCRRWRPDANERRVIDVSHGATGSSEFRPGND